MKRNLIIIMLLVSVLVLAACGAPVAQSFDKVLPSTGMGGGGSGAQPMPGAPSAPESAPLPYSANTTSSPGASPTSAQDRIVIQTVDMSIVIKDPQAKMLEIGALAKRLGGFVVSSNMSQVTLESNQTVPEGSITIRVPAKDLDTALQEIKANTIEVQTENRTGQDVTDKYVDLQSQLKAKQAAADQLYVIMQKTEKADETLLVFNQLTQVQSDIEVLKGQINYYDQASQLSAVSIRLVAEATIKPLVIAGWQPQGVARDAAQALIDFFQNFGTFLIWLVIFIIPVAAVLIVLLALLWRLVRWFWLKLFPRKTVAPVIKE